MSDLPRVFVGIASDIVYNRSANIFAGERGTVSFEARLGGGSVQPWIRI
jgi:hypothetical protein